MVLSALMDISDTFVPLSVGGSHPGETEEMSEGEGAVSFIGKKSGGVLRGRGGCGARAHGLGGCLRGENAKYFFQAPRFPLSCILTSGLRLVRGLSQGEDPEGKEERVELYKHLLVARVRRAGRSRSSW